MPNSPAVSEWNGSRSSPRRLQAGCARRPWRLRCIAAIGFLATVLIGSSAVLTPCADAGGADGVWTALAPPNGRQNLQAVFDPVHERLLVFGGTDGQPRADLWAFSLADSAWQSLHPAGGAPVARHGHTLTYDESRDRWILFGGSTASVFTPGAARLGDVWVLSREGASGSLRWTQVFPKGPGPPARARHTAIYDALQDRLILFGGETPDHVDDVWALGLADSVSWTELGPSGAPPSPREGHAAIFDSARNRMLVFGGSSETRSDELWQLQFGDPPAWTLLTPAGPAPDARTGHGAVFDPSRKRWLVFGGFGTTALLDDLWSYSLDLDLWTDRTPLAPGPGPRTAHALVFDSLGDAAIVVGGANGGFELPDELWRVSAGSPLAGRTPGVWTPIPAAVRPPGRLAHTAIHDPLRDRILVFGGTALSLPADVWALALSGGSVSVPEWTKLEATGTIPIPRADHAAVHDPLRDRMVVFGGRLASGVLTDETLVLDLSDEAGWATEPTTGLRPAARESHIGIHDPVRDRLVIFGGARASGLANDTWALSFSDGSWDELQPGGVLPPARRDHIAIYDAGRDRMVIFGGFANAAPFLSDVWALEFPGLTWTELAPVGPQPEGPITHAGVYDPVRDRMIVFGGSYNNEAWELTFTPTPAWNQTEPTGARPTGRVDHVAVHDPARDRMIVFSGHSGLTMLTDTWVLSWDTPSPAPDVGVANSSTPNLRIVPNPVVRGAEIRFVLPRAGWVSLTVFDVLGRRQRELAEMWMESGSHTVPWDGTNRRGDRLAPGVYPVILSGPGGPARGLLHLLGGLGRP